MQDIIIIDLGCKKSKTKGAIGVDINPDSQADVIHDLETTPYPFPDNHADLIFAKQILEHLNNPKTLIQEAYRILKPGGKLVVEVPHFSNSFSYGDPEHKRFFSYFTFDFLFNKEQLKKITRKICFYHTFRFFGLQKLFNKYPDKYEKFWAGMIPAENIVVELKK